MDTSRRPFRMLRRVAMMAALAALLVPAGTAVAAKKAPKPVVTKVAPMNVSIGETLTVHGKNFRAGKGRNSVVFKRDGAAAVFVKADVSTKRQIKVVLPARLSDHLLVKDGNPVATKFRIRVLSTRFGKSFTSAGKSPLIGPEKPPAPPEPPKPAADGDCDGDGTKNATDADDDNDLLADALEDKLKLDACKRDTDGDGVEDGYELQSARDLNDDNYQGPNTYLPYPHKTPYANPLVADGDQDFDGDGLSLLDEYRLWLTYGQHKTSDGAPLASAGGTPILVLNYSDGKQYSMDVPTVGYPQQQQFLATAASQGYSQQLLLDFDSGVVPGFSDAEDSVADWMDPQNNTWLSPDGAITDVERYYYDRNYDGRLSDDERDEDADGLPNYFEAHGPMRPSWWEHVYDKEKTFVVAYGGTDLTLADSDGDSIIDGADDQDHDDLPNLREIRRQLVAGELKDGAPNYLIDLNPDPMVVQNPPYVRFTLGQNPDGIAWNRPTEGSSDEPLAAKPWRAWVQPFNPCLPDPRSRTCERYPNRGALYPPFEAATPRFNVFDGAFMPE